MIRVELTEHQAEALATLLGMITSDPDWRETSGMTGREWRSVDPAADRIATAAHANRRTPSRTTTAMPSADVS